MKLLKCLIKQNNSGNLNIFLRESVINSVKEFIYKPEEVTFEAYFRRYESIFEKDCDKWPDEKKSYRCGELHLFKDCPFKHKKIPYLQVQRTQILTLQTWRGKLFKK